MVEEQVALAKPGKHTRQTAQLADLVTGFLAESTQALFAMLEHVRSGADTKELLGVSLMLATSRWVVGVPASGLRMSP